MLCSETPAPILTGVCEYFFHVMLLGVEVIWVKSIWGMRGENQGDIVTAQIYNTPVHPNTLYVLGLG